jgi:hypothetical protein|tara:strand:- start:5860 stop:5997 length:138 start_codon:yes stop_codon:yes gene_type:complete
MPATLKSPALAGEQSRKRKTGRRRELRHFMAFPYRVGRRGSKKEG